MINEWLMVAPLPYVLTVVEHPDAPARFQRLYHLATAVDVDVHDPAQRDRWTICTRGQIRSGRWRDRLDDDLLTLSCAPPIIRATGIAILALADQARLKRGER